MTAPALVILAGGRASRLGGGDKGLLMVGGRTILDRILDRLGPSVSRCAINANGDPARFERFGVPVLPDPIADRPGPLAGILAAMGWAGAGDVVTVPGDTPFLPADLVPRLLAGRGDAGVALAASGGRVHPVVGLWPARLQAALRKAIVEGGVRKVEAFAAQCGAVSVEFSTVPADPFFNVNRPEDLAEAERLCRRYGDAQN